MTLQVVLSPMSVCLSAPPPPACFVLMPPGTLHPPGSCTARHQPLGTLHSCVWVQVLWNAPSPSPPPPLPPVGFTQAGIPGELKGGLFQGTFSPWGPTHSLTDAASQGHKARSGSATSGLTLFSVTRALAGRTPTQCPSPSWCVYRASSGFSEGFNTFSHQLLSVPSHPRRLCPGVSSPVGGAAGPAPNGSPRQMSGTAFPGAGSDTEAANPQRPSGPVCAQPSLCLEYSPQVHLQAAEGPKSMS